MMHDLKMLDCIQPLTYSGDQQCGMLAKGYRFTGKYYDNEVGRPVISVLKFFQNQRPDRNPLARG